MKKNHLMFIGIAIFLVNSKAYTQTYWNDAGGLPTSITTTTNGNCHIQGGLFDLTMPTDGVWRTIQGGTNTAGMSIITNTSPTDGPLIALHGKSLPPLLTGEYRDGSIYYNSFGIGSVADPNYVGHRFINYDPTPGSGWHTNMEIGKDGRTIIGPDVDYSFISNGDNLTVRDQIGFWPSGTSAANVRMDGNTTNGSLTLNANTSSSNGASISLWGGAIGGKTQYIAEGGFASGTIAHEFMSTDGLGTFHDNVLIGNDGHVAIGQDNSLAYSSPGDVLSVRDQIGIWPSWTSAAVSRINGNTSTGAFLLNGVTDQTNGASIGMYGAPGGGEIKYISHDYTGGASVLIGHEFMSYDGGALHSHMAIYSNGKVAIGPNMITWPGSTTDLVHPNGYLLFVEQGILTEKLKVANSSDLVNWSDFVFNPDYDLMPLSKVESYVNKNKHLPEIPSASEVAKDGIDVASMDAKLLQKIEELTLYVIEQNKKIESQQKQINDLIKQTN